MGWRFRVGCPLTPAPRPLRGRGEEWLLLQHCKSCWHHPASFRDEGCVVVRGQDAAARIISIADPAGRRGFFCSPGADLTNQPL